MLRVLVATTWHPLDGMPAYCPFTRRMIESSRGIGMDVDLVRPVPWFRWFQQRRRASEGGRNMFPISWKARPGSSREADGTCHANAVLRALDRRGRTYDILHVHGLDASLVMGGIVAERLGLPLVVHAHDSKLPVDARSIEIIRRASRILAVSGEQRKLLVAAYPDCDERIHVLSNGVPSDFFTVAKPDQQRRDALRAVYVGRLHPGKGMGWLLSNWSIVAGENDTLDLYGTGPQEAELRDIVRSRGLQERIRFHGGVLNEKVPEILARYDLMVSPTRSETFGLSNVEAIAVGIPVIVTDLPVIREVLGDCPWALRVALEDVAGFREAMDRLRTLAAPAADLRESVRRYELANVAGELRKHYEQVAGA